VGDRRLRTENTLLWMAIRKPVEKPLNLPVIEWGDSSTKYKACRRLFHGLSANHDKKFKIFSASSSSSNIQYTYPRTQKVGG